LNNSTNSKTKMPKIRFPHFQDIWKPRRIDEITYRISDPVKVDESKEYQQIGIRSHGRGIFYKPFVSGLAIGNKRVFWVKSDTFIVNIVFAWEHAVALTSKQEIGMVASHRFPMYKPNEEYLDIEFLWRLFLTKKGKYLLGLASPGGAGRNKTLGQNTFNELKVSIPTVPEQQKIAAFLSAVDKKIQLLQRKKELLEQYKKGVMQKIFSQEIRFKDENGNDYPEWVEKKLGDITYKESSNISANSIKGTGGNYPVYGAAGYIQNIDYYQQAGEYIAIVKDGAGVGRCVMCPPKSSVLGTLDTIHAKGNHSLGFVFRVLQQIRFQRYISGSTIPHIYFKDYSKDKLGVPINEEQSKISKMIGQIDCKIQSIADMLSMTERFKNGLLQQMFV
jgi:type I restriction enzyme, S subunit